MTSPVFAGIDLGSISLNVVIIDNNASMLTGVYERINGRPLHTLLKVLHTLSARYSSLDNIFVTGSGRNTLSRLFSCKAVNEIIAHGEGAAFLNPDIRTIMEIGGQDSKLILLHKDERTSRAIISDSAMNDVCAAGTGSFLDQQAKRLGLPIEELGDIALRSKRPAHIAGRCSVFAKSDMIHLQQQGVPVDDIVAGLCHALARGFLSNLCKGRELPRPIQFQGGVAANKGVIKAFETLLNLPPGGLIIPENFLLMGAYGAALFARNERPSREYTRRELIDLLKKEIRTGRNHRSCLPSLPERKASNLQASFIPSLSETKPMDVFLGIDVGAVSANLALLDTAGNVVGKRYLFTSGRPAETVKSGLAELGGEFGPGVRVKGVAVTGSGRYFIGRLVGADMVINEITAQAKAALYIDPAIDTLFEIGGQDAKYIRFEHGAVADFEMNKVCAAGTGAFLEEQAARLNMDIKADFSNLAFKGASPGDLGTRCTVFMESDLIHHQQSGLGMEDLAAGLAYAIVNNYMEKVVANRKIGGRVYFQGGVAGNRAVVAAMESVIGERIHVHEHHDITGAMGAALAVREAFAYGLETSFAGFDLRDRDMTVKTFTCRHCANLCDIRRIFINDEEKGVSGGICGRYDHRKSDAPDLLQERQVLLTGLKQDLPSGMPVIGIPRSIFFYEDYPFWHAYLSALGYRVLLSDETSRELIYKGLKRTGSETCLPVKAAYGHIEDLMEKGVGLIFFPSVAEAFKARADLPRTHYCPYIQGLPYMLQAGFEGRGPVKFITPVLSFSNGTWKETLLKLAEGLGKNRQEAERAVDAAYAALSTFQEQLVKRGKELLSRKDERTVILLGKSYHLFDEGQNMHIGKRLRNAGITAIPYDFLPLGEVELPDIFENVVWKNTHDLMRAAMIAKEHSIPVIMLTNFGCGPDSFAMKYLEDILAGHPFMILEVDEHTADAGMATRIEAFLDTIMTSRTQGAQSTRDYRVIIKGDDRIRSPFAPDPKVMSLLKNRTLYFHHVSDGMNRIMESAFGILGVKAKSLPTQDHRTEQLGRRHSSGLECHPYIVSTGDIIKLTEEEGFDPCRTAILLMSYDGCCRYSQYGLSYKMALNKLGLQEVLMVNPLVSGRYEELSGIFGLNFTQAIWKGWLSAGVLENYLLSRRPYELEKGSVDRAYDTALNDLAHAVRDFSQIDFIYDAGLISALKKGVDMIKAVPCDRGRKRPRAGVYGEFFSVLNSWANQELFRKLESMGLEVKSSGLFILTNFLSFFAERYHEEELRKKHGPAGYYYGKLKKHWLMAWARRIERELDTDTEDIRILPTEKMIRDISPFINPDLDPLSTTYLARTIDLADRGIAGINYLIVLNCMLSNMTIPIIKRILARYHDLPFLATAYDGFKETNTLTRLEAFVHQTTLYHERHCS
jgi:predicted CoA-substrate-specific enzyme activase